MKYSGLPLRIAIATVSITLCAIVAIVVTEFLGLAGRNFIPLGLIATAFILLLSFAFRYCLRWTIREMKLSLVSYQVIVILAAWRFGGFDFYHFRDPYAFCGLWMLLLLWLLINLFTGLPWMLGIVIGNVLLGKQGKEESST